MIYKFLLIAIWIFAVSASTLNLNVDLNLGSIDGGVENDLGLIKTDVPEGTGGLPEGTGGV